MKKFRYAVVGSCVGFVIGAISFEALILGFIRPETKTRILKDLEDRATEAHLANVTRKEFYNIVKNQ